MEPLLEYIRVLVALSDYFEQPHLPFHPRPLRRYTACSYEPVLSFEVWIHSTVLRMVRTATELSRMSLSNHFGFQASYFVFIQIRVTIHERRATIH